MEGEKIFRDKPFLSNLQGGRDSYQSLGTAKGYRVFQQLQGDWREDTRGKLAPTADKMLEATWM